MLSLIITLPTRHQAGHQAETNNREKKLKMQKKRQQTKQNQWTDGQSGDWINKIQHPPIKLNYCLLPRNLKMLMAHMKNISFKSSIMEYT